MRAFRFFDRALRRAFPVARLALNPFSPGTRVKLLIFALIGLTAFPYLFWLVHARRCRKDDHDHSTVEEMVDGLV